VLSHRKRRLHEKGLLLGSDKVHGFNSAMNAGNTTPHQSDQAIVERSGQPEKPGALQGQVWFSVQTQQAQLLIHGRKATPDKPTIIGLVGFADRLRVIWEAARRDDPYADWWLIRIHEALESEVGFVRNWQKEIRELLSQMSAMDISIAASSRPYRIALRFANPYAYQAALLLSEYDALVCLVLTAHHVGLLDSEGKTALIKSCARRIRALFTIPQSYRMLKIDRESVQLHTGRSNEARQIMGEVPADILSGARQAPLAPRKVKFPTRVAGQVALHPEPPPSSAKSSDHENDDD